ncbi:MAG TPA: hypothetical protein VFA98_01785 [Thermoanaerobaculia bacterium]|jgi:hypothetical protein|nr:hypothetical protein [Thermoanaerobaculia bacterium]
MTNLERLAKLHERMREDTQEGRLLRRAFEAGAEAAADLADQYNGSTAHEYKLGDCILGKMNIRKGRPRKNEDRILSHKELLEILGPRRAQKKFVIYLPR